MSTQPLGTVAQQVQPLASVSVVSNGNGDELQELLNSLVRNEPAGQIQLLITDNLGRDLPEIEPAGWHSVVMLRPARPRGFASNHNAAFRSATGVFFCVLNPDVVFLEGILLQLVQRLDQAEGHIAAPFIVDSRGNLQDSFRQLPSPWGLIRRRIGCSQPTSTPEKGSLVHPDWISGTFMLMRSEIFSRLGGFDTGYRLYFEDVDLCTRARLMGLRIMVDPGLRLRHDPRWASRSAGMYLFWHVQSALRFFASGVYRRARALQPHD